MSKLNLVELAQVGATVVAAFALAANAFQVRAANNQASIQRETHKKTSAFGLWANFAKYDFEQTDFILKIRGATIFFAERKIVGDKIPRESENIVFEKYLAYMSLLLWACEEMWEAHLGNKEWEETIKNQLLKHKDYLLSDFFRVDNGLGVCGYKMSAPNFRRLLDHVLKPKDVA